MRETVTYTRMADGTARDYEILAPHHREYHAALADRVLAAFEQLRTSFDGLLVTRYEHSLQTATRAERDGRDDEYVVMALLHDVGDELAPFTHGELAAAILRPFVRPELVAVVRHHTAFQLKYYGTFVGQDPDAREAFRDQPWFDACDEFCAQYDQESFDPAYDTLPVEHFVPIVRAVLAEPRYLRPSDTGTGR